MDDAGATGDSDDEDDGDGDDDTVVAVATSWCSHDKPAGAQTMSPALANLR